MPRKPAQAAGDGSHLTHERIADDLKAFRKRGGRIEVLGNTPPAQCQQRIAVPLQPGAAQAADAGRQTFARVTRSLRVAQPRQFAWVLQNATLRR